jgi:hypothetical protein
MSFAGMNKTSHKRHNSAPAWAAKVDLRERVLRYVGPRHARVFDAFAGTGELHRAVWHKAARYTGCDKQLILDARTMFCADNRRVLRCIDLGAFNVFDLDAFGSPWEQATIVAARRPVKRGERLGLVLTMGEGMNLKLGHMPMALRALAGFARGAPTAGRNGEIGDRAIRALVGRMGCEIEHFWQAKGRTGAQMRYVGLALRGLGAGKRP